MRRRTSKNLLPEKMVGAKGLEPIRYYARASKTRMSAIPSHAHISKEQP